MERFRTLRLENNSSKCMEIIVMDISEAEWAWRNCRKSRMKIQIIQITRKCTRRLVKMIFS